MQLPTHTCIVSVKAGSMFLSAWLVVHRGCQILFLMVPSRWWVHPILLCGAVPSQLQDSALAVVELWASCQLVIYPVWVTHRCHPALQGMSFELKTTGCDYSDFSTHLVIPLCNPSQPGLAIRYFGYFEMLCWRACCSQWNVLLSLCPPGQTSCHWRKSG